MVTVRTNALEVFLAGSALLLLGLGKPVNLRELKAAIEAARVAE